MKPFYISLKPFLDYRHLPCPVDWKAIFNNDRPLEVEIGFGNGEYLARLAQERPGINFVGFEEYCERIHKTLRKLSRVPNEGIKVFRMDVRPAFKYLFTPKSIQYIHCLYPPPWPKKSDIKHRLFTTEFFKLANNRLMEGGVLKIVTDHHPYILWIQEQLPGTGFNTELKRIAASYNTKFERKWAEGGQEEFFELLLTKQNHMPVTHHKEEALKHYTLEAFDPGRFHMPPFSDQGIAVVFKDILFDAERKTALIHVLVNDEHIFQNIRIIIQQTQSIWHMNLADGTMMMPTAGVVKALDLVHEAAQATS